MSEKLSVHLPTFLRRNDGDPATKVSYCVFTNTHAYIFDQNFFSKLRDHILSRIQASLQDGTESSPAPPSNNAALSIDNLDESARNFVLLKHERIYRHKIVRFNFTAYDVRRGTDIVKPDTSRCNIMLLADRGIGPGASDLHPFLYARVLGAYHANVIYTGPGMRDYEARRFDFLWVRWYEVTDPGSLGWTTGTLDMIRFPPMHQDSSFGFVDPKDVLRACHVLPVFAKGKRNETQVDISRCARDHNDYKSYYIGRWVVKR